MRCLTDRWYQDIVDRDLDKRVARTKGRPLPSGAISVTGALAYCVLQSAITQGLFLQLLPAEAYVSFIPQSRVRY
jgi:4-hydroxybenzoate polyprenyltransferase